MYTYISRYICTIDKFNLLKEVIRRPNKNNIYRDIYNKKI